MVADAHRNDGGMGLTIDNSVSMWPYDQDTGDNIFDKIKIQPEKMVLSDLARKKPSENFSSHRSFTRDTFYADHYLPILLQRKNNSIVVRVGFDLQNSAKMKTNTKTQQRKLLQGITQLLPMCNQTQQLADREYADLNDLFSAMEETEHFSKQLSANQYCYLRVNKLKLHEYWRKQHNTRTGKLFDGKAIEYKILRYTTALYVRQVVAIFEFSIPRNLNFWELKKGGQLKCSTVTNSRPGQYRKLLTEAPMFLSTPWHTAAA